MQQPSSPRPKPRRCPRSPIWTLTLLALLLGTLTPAAGTSAETPRVPHDTWMRYADVAEAGFDAGRLEVAREAWQELPSSAFLVIADGAVVAAWGDVERRFMCHSVRKSFLSALYGIYWDRGEIELNKRLSDLGIDDFPDPLLPIEREARILDLLKARSGVFHPAAYAGRTDSQPRGSQGPGRYFAYNNWDFNTLATILMQETGEDVFEAFDAYFGQPLEMEDWRVSDGYYHYERDKSRYPAYPFRLSARDAARFGLLFAREGLWHSGGEARRILSRHWVRRSSALYSIDSERMGYGFMWWVFREPHFAQYGMYAALGVGNQMIAVLPEIDMVIINRANTYAGESTPMPELLDVIEQVLDARTGTPVAEARLAPLEPAAAGPLATRVPRERLAHMIGKWTYPPAPLGLEAQTSIEISIDDNGEGTALRVDSPNSGTFLHYLQPDGSLHEEDSHDRYFAVQEEGGEFAGIASANTLMTAALNAAVEGDTEQAHRHVALLGDFRNIISQVGLALLSQLEGNGPAARRALSAAVEEHGTQAQRVATLIGGGFLQEGHLDAARSTLELVTEMVPDASGAWERLGATHEKLGNMADALRCTQRAVEAAPENRSARQQLDRLQAAAESDTSENAEP